MNSSEVSIWINFPFTGNQNHYVIDSTYTFDDINIMIMSEFNLNFNDFDILSSNQQITDQNFKLYDNISFNVIPRLKTGRHISKSQKKTSNKMFIVNKKKKSYNYISPNFTEPTESADSIFSKYIRNYDKNEFENLDKKYKIAIENEYEIKKKTDAENEKSHQKLKEILEKIKSSKKKKNTNDAFCGSNKEFLL